VVNGFFVATEFALVALRRTRVEEMVNAKVPRSASLLEAITHLDRSVAAAQLGITVASLALGLLSEPALHVLVTPVLDPLLSHLPPGWQVAIGRTLTVAITLSLVTYMHVVFGEQMPKMAALQASERIGLIVAGPTNAFARLTHPVIRLMNGSSEVFLRLLGFKSVGHDGDVHTVDELRLLIEDSEEAGVLDPEAADYVLNVFGLTNKKVRDVMVPWDKVMAIDVSLDPDSVLSAVREGSHTRIPVYDGDPTNIVGIVNTKDLFHLYSLKGLVTIEDARYDATFVSPEMPVSHALRMFRKTRRPMVVVRDAAKRVLGIVTLEDVLEEIDGDIEDEHDDPARVRVFVNPNRRTVITPKLTPKLPPKHRPGAGGM
jgi:putative hemolysin